MVSWRRIGDGVTVGVGVAVAVPVCVGEGNGVRVAVGSGVPIDARSTSVGVVVGDGGLTAVAVAVEATSSTWAAEPADRAGACETDGSAAVAELQPTIATRSSNAEGITHLASVSRIPALIPFTTRSGPAAKGLQNR